MYRNPILPSSSEMTAVAVITRALPDLPLPLELMVRRILRMPGGELNTLKGVCHQTVFEGLEIGQKTAMSLREMLELGRELRCETNLVLHSRIPPMRAFSIHHRLNSPSSPSWPDRYWRLHHAWAPLPPWPQMSGDKSLRGNAGQRAHHYGPSAGSVVGESGNLWC